MTLITTSRLNWFTDTMAQAVEHLPKVMADVRETAEDRERLILEQEMLNRTIDTLNIQIQDLKDQNRSLTDRLQDEYKKTARAEHLITTTVKQLANSDAFHDAAKELLAANGQEQTRRIQER